MATYDQQPFVNQPRHIAMHWFAALGGAFAWALAFGLHYGLVEVACGIGSSIPLHIASLLCIAIAAAALVVAVRLWHQFGRSLPGEAGGPLPRSRLLTVVGLLGNAFFIIVIVAQWLTVVFLHPCMAI